MLKKNKYAILLGVLIFALCGTGCKSKKEEVSSQTSFNEVNTEKTVLEEEKLSEEDEVSDNETADETEAVEIPAEKQPEKPEDVEDDDERITEFFNDSVLTGDSISKHFGNFITKHKEALPGQMFLLSEGSFSLHNAKEEPTADSTFPLYKGEKMKIEDAVSLMGVHNVFMFFGINDLGRGTPEDCLALYDEQIDKIKQKSPDAVIFIISPTYLHKDKAAVYKNLNNKNIKKFNDMLTEYCDTTQKAVYVDLATKLTDADGNLKDEFCNDKYCHHTEKAFKIWIEVLMNQAKMEVVKE